MVQLPDSSGSPGFPAEALPAEQRVVLRAGRWKRIFAFPNPVNEYAARFTAGLVVVLALVTLLTGWAWGLVILAIGFVLRVLFGPRISPFALLSVKVLAPRIGAPKLVPGPPKRFAQGIGAVISIAAAVCYFAGIPLAAWVLLVLLIVAASLESFLGFCLGCAIFEVLQRIGLIPNSVCEACHQIGLRSALHPSH
ncbi:DUF4395 domain-containing protein [Psychromicrobium sp. YIM B11713]|uniref:DUF4395 domain-containing protein n=1 Tax=Psychromicrobium sp. YIM B11713 TaxID=3145233 RepID=UPI00374F74A8